MSRTLLNITYSSFVYINSMDIEINTAWVFSLANDGLMTVNDVKIECVDILLCFLCWFEIYDLIELLSKKYHLIQAIM